MPRWVPWPLVALVMVTVGNYVWQVPYYLHFDGQLGNSPGGAPRQVLENGRVVLVRVD